MQTKLMASIIYPLYGPLLGTFKMNLCLPTKKNYVLFILILLFWECVLWEDLDFSLTEISSLKDITIMVKYCLLADGLLQSYTYRVTLTDCFNVNTGNYIL